ncbi:MAG: MFS transporter [Actinobacteria bacterium]|nr:MFS transporter [Actinomycetota bacterium]
MRRFGSATQLRLDAVVFGYFMPIGMLFVGVSRFVREELGGGDFVVGLSTTIFFVSAIVARPWAGRVMDRIGRRPFIVPPLVGMAMTTVLIAMCTQVWMVVVLRVVQGAMGSMLYTALAATATDLSPPERRGAAMARLSVMVYLGFAIGPFVGEFLFGRHHWWLFAVAGSMTACAALVALGLPETKPEVADAPVPLRWWAMVQTVSRPGFAQFTVGFGYACLISFLPKYSREVGLGQSGPLFVTFAVCTLLVRAVSGPMGDRVGYAMVALPGVVCIGLGLASLALAQQAWMAFPAIALVGTGFGASFPALTAIAAQRAPDAARAAALGTFLSFNDLGSALAGPLVGAIGQQVGFRWVYGTPALMAIVGAFVVTTLLPGRSGYHPPAAT